MGSNSYVKCRYQLLEGFMLRDAEKNCCTERRAPPMLGQGMVLSVENHDFDGMESIKDRGIDD